MEKELEKIKSLLAENGIDFEKSDLKSFVHNWMPQSNYDYQQEYFLMELRTCLYESLTAHIK